MTTNSSQILLLMAFALGIRHGFDLDHLATIDSITRTVKENVRLSKFVGFLFSLGHGLVVILLSLVIGSGIIKTRAPLWLAAFGSWISIIFLLLFGLITLWNVVPNRNKLSAGFPTSLRVFLCKKLLGENNNPLLIMLIGALFAFSFDTFTQVALFSLSVSAMAGIFFSIILAIVFMIGMIAADGLNGFFVFSLIQLADKKSKLISQIVGLSIAFFSLVLGLLDLVNQLDW